MNKASTDHCDKDILDSPASELMTVNTAPPCSSFPSTSPLENSSLAEQPDVPEDSPELIYGPGNTPSSTANG